jgi:hypothetical protein
MLRRESNPQSWQSIYVSYALHRCQDLPFELMRRWTSNGLCIINTEVRWATGMDDARAEQKYRKSPNTITRPLTSHDHQLRCTGRPSCFRTTMLTFFALLLRLIIAFAFLHLSYDSRVMVLAQENNGTCIDSMAFVRLHLASGLRSS